MNSTAALVAYLVGSLIFIVVALMIPGLKYYIGGIFVVFFVLGIFYLSWNTIRQAAKMGKEQSSTQIEPLSKDETPH
jgi:FtsH-binding integral membrane protein